MKLFGESDIGRHLSLLFNENHTLFEVNKTLQFVANSVEDIRDDLEMNIIHDQYDTPAELVGDIERMTDEVGQYTETFYFPLVGNMEDEDDGEQYEVGKYAVGRACSSAVLRTQISARTTRRSIWMTAVKMKPSGKPSSTADILKCRCEYGKGKNERGLKESTPSWTR